MILWFLQGFGFENGAFGMVEDQDNSVLAAIATKVAWIFAPLGFGNWKATVASVTGLIAKENVVGTFGVLYNFGGELSENGDEDLERCRCRLHRSVCLRVYDLQPAVRSLLRCDGRDQA